MCRTGGVPLGLIDRSQLAAMVPGYAITAIESARASIVPLAQFYVFDVVETGGRLRFVPRGRAAVAQIAADTLVITERNAEDISFTRVQETELPRALKWRLQMTFANAVTQVGMGQANLTAQVLGPGGATADSTNRLSINTPAVLLNNAGAGIEATVNKAAAANDATFAFKTAFSARALFGLLGSDDFSIKVSPDGSAFYEAIRIDRNTCRPRWRRAQYSVRWVAIPPGGPMAGSGSTPPRNGSWRGRTGLMSGLDRSPAAACRSSRTMCRRPRQRSQHQA